MITEHTPAIGNEVHLGITDHAERVAQTVRIVTHLSHMAGKDIPILPLADVDSETYEPGVYIMESWLGPDATISNADFELNKRLLSGASDSAHAVIAGKLHIDYNDTEHSAPDVAIKCFSKRTAAERLERGVREIRYMEEMLVEEALGFIPVALVIAPQRGILDSEVVVLTLHDKTILTMDNLPWGRGLTSENLDYVLQATDAVSRFNRSGRQHGDAKIKNVAQDEAGLRATSMIDFETTTSFDSTSPFEAATATQVDLGLLLKSVDDKGFFARAPEYKRAQALAHIADTYLDSWQDASPEVQTAVMEEVVNITDRYMQAIPAA
jgi:hypothetical protein